MSFYSTADENHGSFFRFIPGGGIGDSEKQALRKKYPIAREQTGDDSDKDNTPGGNAGSIANMERNDYLTLLAEQMHM